MTEFGFGSPTIRAFIYGTGKADIDLGNYITNLTTSKTMEQAAGTFSFTLPYAPDRKSGLNLPSPKEVLDQVKPNDYMEMMIQDKPGNPAYFMNGFIDDVSFTEDGGGGNDFQRTVTLSGRDYGSLLQNYSVQYITNSKDLAQYASTEALAYTLEKVGKKGDASFPFMVGAAKFVDGIVDIVINKHHIAGLKTFYNPHIQEILHTAYVPHYLGADGLGLQSYTGSIDDLFRQIQSPPWAEYFIRDEEAHGVPGHFSQPHLYYRIAPYVSYNPGSNPEFPDDGKLAWYQDIRYGSVNLVEISRKDVMSVELTQSQQEVYTYFLTVPSGQSYQELGNDVTATGLNLFKGLGNPYYSGNEIGSGQDGVERARRFGFRILEAQSPWVLGDPKQATFISSVPGVGAQFWDLLKRLNEWLVATQGHNEKLYSGSLTNRGIHGVRIGDYIKYKDLYLYVQSVNISWSEGSPVTEHLEVIRGSSTNKIPFPLR